MNEQLVFDGMEWDGPTYVYFAAREGLIKIGVTSDPKRRARELDLTMLLVIPGGRDDERRFHRRWRRYRSGLEWFMPNASLLAFIMSRGGTAPIGWPWAA